MVKKRNFKKKVLISWGISYLLLSVIPIAFFFFFLATCISILNNETQYYNSLAVEHVRSVMDRVFVDVNAAATELFLDEGLSEISKYEAFRDVPAYMLFDEISRIQRIETTKSYIEGLIVYSPSMDLYVSAERYGQLSRIHSLGEYNLQLTSAEAERIFSDRSKTMKIYDAAYVFPNGHEVNRIIITRPLNYLRTNFYVAAVVSVDALIDSESEFGSYHNIMIFSSTTGRLLYDISGSEDIDGNVSLSTIFSDENPWKGDIIAEAPSNETNFTYVIRIMKSAYYHSVYLMCAAMAIYIVLVIVFVGLFTRKRLKKDWNELESAINKIGANTEEAEGIYSPFVSSVSRLEKEKEGLGTVIEKQTASLQSSMLKSLVSGSDDPAFVSQRALEECGIIFPSDIFIVMILETDKISEVEKCIYENISENMMIGYPFSSQYGAAVLFSFTKEYLSAKNDIYHDIAIYADKLPKELITGIAASDKVEGIENIGNAYVSAISTLEYRKNMNIKELVFSHDVNAMANGIKYIYPPEMAFSLSNAVSDGNGDEAVMIIRNLYKTNTEAGVSPRHLRYLLFAISNDILRMSVKLEDILGTSFTPFTVPAILQTRNPEAVRMNLEDNIKKFCFSVVEARNAMGNIQDDTYRVYQKAISLIDERYSDSLLNVSEVADILGISLAYLSKIFKRYHRANISDYISHIRVEAAKRELERGEQMQDIATKCGFGSLRTFMRVFRKLEGVTPGQYRSYKKEEE